MTVDRRRPSDPARLAADAARTFASAAGERILDHLRAMTRERVLGPDAPDALLRHVEGQRALVQHLEALVERGRYPAAPAPQQQGEPEHDD